MAIPVPTKTRSGNPAAPRGRLNVKTSVLALALTAIWAMPTFADPALDVLVAAYPDHLAGYEGNDLIWKDGTRMPISDGRSNKTFDQLLDTPDIKDQFAFPYPLG